MKNYFFAIVCIFLAGCASAPLMLVQPGAQKIQVAKSDPGDNYEIIGPVSVIDGKGCGKFGYEGSYERAITALRNKILGMGGDYAQLVLLTEPLLRGKCFDNRFILRATAYKKAGSLDHSSCYCCSFWKYSME